MYSLGIIGGLIGLYLTFKAKKRIGFKLSIIWYNICGITVIVSIFPSIIDFLMKISGMYMRANFVFTIAILILFTMVFYSIVQNRKNEEGIRKIVKGCTIEMNEVREKLKEKNT